MVHVKSVWERLKTGGVKLRRDWRGPSFQRSLRRISLRSKRKIRNMRYERKGK